MACSLSVGPESSAPLEIFGRVFGSDVCRDLHELALDHAERGGLDGSSIFYRDHSNSSLPMTPLETALDSILREIGDNNPIVEYWSRQEYLNLDAHADIDEEELEDDGVLRYPTWGHVLYLHMERDHPAPTAVFPSRLGGWSQDSAEDCIPLVFVPAVAGRVLRFPGAALHAVPKPAARWLLTPHDQQQLDALEDENEGGFDSNDDNFMDKSEDEWDEEDEGDEEDDWIERSVILFNTWSEEGPRGVARDTGTAGALPDGIALVEDDPNDREQKKREEWHEQFGVGMKDLWCAPRKEWTPVQLCQESSQEKTNGRLCVPLMGNEERRLHPHRFVQLDVVSKDIRHAALQPLRPTQVWVKSSLL